MSYDILLIGFATLMVAIILVFFFVMLFLYQMIKKQYIGEKNQKLVTEDVLSYKPKTKQKKEKHFFNGRDDGRIKKDKAYEPARKTAEKLVTTKKDVNIPYVDMTNYDVEEGCDEDTETLSTGKANLFSAFSEKRKAKKIKKKEMKDQVAKELEVWGIEDADIEESEKDVEEPINLKDKLIYLFQNTVWFKIVCFAVVVGLLALLVVLANPTYTTEAPGTTQTTDTPSTSNTETPSTTAPPTSPTVTLPKEDDLTKVGENKAMAAQINNNNGQMGNTTNSSQPLIAEPPQQQAQAVSTGGSIPSSYTGSSTNSQPSGSLGTLSIPSINLKNAPIMPSVSLGDMAKGVGHFTETPLDGGNIGLAGHNNTFFQYLKDVNIGDVVEYTVDGVTNKYEVVSKEQIAYNDWSVLSSTDTNQLTMISCVRNQPDKRLAVFAVELGQSVKNAPSQQTPTVKSGTVVTKPYSNEWQDNGYHDEGGGYSDYIGTFTGGY